MGGGVAGWLTPGWMTYDNRFAPHIATPGIVSFYQFNFRVREADAQRRREPKG